MLRWRVTRPLHRLERVAQQLASSHEPQLVSEEGPTEVRQLAHTFNSMSTRIQAAQTELENSRSHLASIIDSAMDAIITVDGDLRIRVFNPAAAHMFGYTEEQIAWFGLTFGVGAFMLYMVFIIFQLARESKAGRFGTFVLFLALGFGLLGFAAKGVIKFFLAGAVE